MPVLGDTGSIAGNVPNPSSAARPEHCTPPRKIGDCDWISQRAAAVPLLRERDLAGVAEVHLKRWFSATGFTLFIA